MHHYDPVPLFRQLDDADEALARMPELVVDRYIFGRWSQRIPAQRDNDRLASRYHPRLPISRDGISPAPMPTQP